MLHCKSNICVWCVQENHIPQSEGVEDVASATSGMGYRDQYYQMMASSSSTAESFVWTLAGLLSIKNIKEGRPTVAVLMINNIIMTD